MFYGLNKQQHSILQNTLAILGSLFGRVFHADHLVTMERNMGFYDDEAFMKAFRNSATNAQENSLVWRVHTLAWAAHHCTDLAGDFMECGVYKGFCSGVLVDYLDFPSLDKTFYLHDTFEGMPEGHEKGSPVPVGSYKVDGLFESVRQRFAPSPNVKVVKGVVPEVFKESCPEALAFLHLDMNSAVAEVGALEVLFDRVSPSGVMVFDDYGWFPYRAQKQMVDPFMAERGYQILELPTGQGMVVKR